MLFLSFLLNSEQLENKKREIKYNKDFFNLGLKHYSLGKQACRISAEFMKICSGGQLKFFI